MPASSGPSWLRAGSSTAIRESARRTVEDCTCVARSLHNGRSVRPDRRRDPARQTTREASMAQAFTRRVLMKAGAGAAGGLLTYPRLVRAEGADAVKVSLEFRIYGGNAPM